MRLLVEYDLLFRRALIGITKIRETLAAEQQPISIRFGATHTQ